MSTKQKTGGKVRRAFEQKLETLSKKIGGKKSERVKTPTKTDSLEVKDDSTRTKSRSPIPFLFKTKSKHKSGDKASGELPLTDDEKLEQRLATPTVSHTRGERRGDNSASSDGNGRELVDDNVDFITTWEDDSEVAQIDHTNMSQNRVKRGDVIHEEGETLDNEEKETKVEVWSTTNGDAQNDDDEDQTDDVAIPEDHSSQWLDEALVLLDSCRMSSAERLLCKTVKHMRELPDKEPEVYVKALNGLTQVYARKARKARYNPMEAQWWLIVSLTLLKEGINECKSADEETEAIQELANKTSSTFSGFDAELMARLYSNAVAERKAKKDDKGTETPPIEETGLVEFSGEDTPPDFTWLKNFMKYCFEKIEIDSSVEDDDDVSDDTVVLGSDVSDKQSLSDDLSERASSPALSTSSSSSSLVLARQKAVAIHRDSITCDDVNIESSMAPGASAIRRAYSFRSKARSGSVVSRTQSQRERPRTPDGASTAKRQSVPSLLPEDSKEEHRSRLLQLRQKYLYKKQRLSSSSSIQEETEETKPPVTEKTLNTTLAYAVSRLADIFLDKKEYMLALFLYIRSFNMFRSIEANAISNKHIANMLKNMANIKSKQGDPIGAIGFMERALTKFKQVYGDDHPEVVDTLFQLGDLYMLKRWHGESVMDSVITVIHNEINKDFLADQTDFETGASDYDDLDDTASTVGSIDDLDLSDDEDDGESYNVYAKEAFNFYEKVVKIAESGRVQDEHNFVERALIKMGDCCFMCEDFDGAVKYYEKSIAIMQEGTSLNIEYRAHVLNMIAIIYFIQKHYGKAVTMFSAANVLNQSLLGMNSANFEIACVYSLWGITCWIMNDADKGLSPCILAHEIFTRLFTNHQHLLPMKRKWLISEVTYILGCMFRELHFFSKAMDYLTLCLQNAESSIQQNISWTIRILIAIGQCYVMQKDYDTALNSYYYHSLELIRDARTITPGLELLRIEILTAIVDIHDRQRNYDLFIEYSEQLLNYYAFDSCKYYKDIVSALERVAKLYTLRGDLAKSIKSYTEAIDTFEEYHGYLASEMGPTVARLALLYHVQSCQSESDDDKLELIEKAGEKYAKAFQLDGSSFSAVLYMNYLCGCKRFGEAVSILEKIEYLTGEGPSTIDLNRYIVLVMPECVEIEWKMYADSVVPISSLGFYLAVLSYINVDNMVFSQAYAKRLENESSKEGEKPSIKSTIAAFAQLLVCEYNKAASIFGNLYTQRHNSEYLGAFWTSCYQEVDMTHLFICHEALHYIRNTLGQSESESSEEETEEWATLGETTILEVINGEQISRVVTEEPADVEESRENDEEWHVFEEYTVEETPRTANEFKHRLSQNKQDDEWKMLESYTVSEDQAKDFRSLRLSSSTSAHSAGSAETKSHVKGEIDDEWRVLEEYTTDDAQEEKRREASSSGEGWVTLEEYTEDFTPYIADREVETVRETRSIETGDELMYHNNNVEKNWSDETYNIADNSRELDRLQVKSKTPDGDSGVESQFSESKGSLDTNQDFGEEIEEEWEVYEEYVEEYIVPN